MLLFLGRRRISLHSFRRMGTDTHVLFEVRNRTGIITMNRPKALNSLSLPMVRAIYPVLRKWEKEVDAIIIEPGEGHKAFCAGGDVVAVTSLEKGSPNQIDFFKEEYRLNNYIGKLKIPYIALLNGITMGGGVGLSIHGKYRVASEKTLFAMPETAIGLFPDVGGSYFLPRLQGKLGMYLALTGYRLKGSDVIHAGIATHGCRAEEMHKLREDLIAADKSGIDSILNNYNNKFNLSDFSLLKNLNDINNYFNAEDDIQTVIDNLKSAAKTNPWAEKTYDTMNKMCPMSMKITFREIVHGAKLSSLTECLKMEYRMVSRCLKDPNFYEGVRALLVDKDNNPKWNPSTLEEVSDEVIQKYFTLLPSEQELILDD